VIPRVHIVGSGLREGGARRPAPTAIQSERGFAPASSDVRSVGASSSGDMAYLVGHAANEFRGPREPVAYAGKCSMVWRRRAGQWEIVLYSVSSDQPEPVRHP
jgi:hypothetical protein